MRILTRKIGAKRLVGMDPKYFKSQLDMELQRISKLAKTEFKKPVRQWNGPPDFDIKSHYGGGEIIVEVVPIGPNADKFRWIDLGTRSRSIYPKNGAYLRFKPGYKASTIPGTLWSRKAQRSGNFVSPRVVRRHKIKARNFSKTVHDKINPSFRRNMENLIRRSLRRG